MKTVPVQNSPLEAISPKGKNAFMKMKGEAIGENGMPTGAEFENLLKMIETKAEGRGIDLGQIFSKGENQFLQDGQLPLTEPVGDEEQLLQVLNTQKVPSQESLPFNKNVQALNSKTEKGQLEAQKTFVPFSEFSFSNAPETKSVDQASVQGLMSKETKRVERSEQGKVVELPTKENSKVELTPIVKMGDAEEEVQLPKEEKNIRPGFVENERDLVPQRERVITGKDASAMYGKQASVNDDSMIKATADQVVIGKDGKPVKVQKKNENDQREDLFFAKATTTKEVAPKNAMNMYQNNSFDQRVIRQKPEAFNEVKKKSENSITSAIESNEQSTLQAFGQKESGRPANTAAASVTSANNSAGVLDLRAQKINTNIELVNNIANYLEQNQVASQKHVEVIVRHETLGDFTVKAHRSGLKGDQVEIEIASRTDRAAEFFVRNESNLHRALTESGIVVSDIKVGMSSEGRASSESGSKDMNFSDHRGGQQFRDHGRGETTRDQDSRRRQELWQAYAERGVA